jgi:Gnt-I system high-affinity gluconate transporter
MELVIVAVGVALLILLMTKFKMNGFIALILVSIFVGLLDGMPLDKLYDSIIEGVGGQLDDLVLILGFGAMLGKVLADSGAAQKIATTMVRFFGISRVQLAMVLTAFAIGITMFYEVGFVLLIPLVFTIVRENKLPLLWVGLPMSIALSTMHSFLPPHPGPAAVAGTFGASMGLTLFYGLFIAIPAAAFIAFTWPRLGFVRKINPPVPYGLITDHDFPEEELPSFATCLAIVLTPVVLMGASAVATITMTEDNPALVYFSFFGESPIALLIGLLLAFVLLTRPRRQITAKQPVESEKYVESYAGGTTGGTTATVTGGTGGGAGGKTGIGTGGAGASSPTGSGGGTDADAPNGSAGNGRGPSDAPAESRYADLMRSCGQAAGPMAMIILVIGAGGAFKQVLIDGGTADYVADLTSGWNISPIILAWAIAAVMRTSLGSATVAVVTAAGIVAPLVASSGVRPELMVLAVSSGSIFASHVNDPGFWLFKEYFNLSVIEAIKTRTTYTTVLAIIGLGGVLLLNTVV